MAKKARSHNNERTALTLAKKVFSSLGKTLYFIGKPSYFFLSTILIVILFTLNITGHIIYVILIALTRVVLGFLLGLISEYSLFWHTVLKTLGKINIPKSVKKTGSIYKRFKNRIILSTKPLVKLSDSIQITFLRAKVLSLRTLGVKIEFKFPRIKLRYLILLTFILSLIVIPILGYIYLIRDLPSPEALITRPIEVSTKIYDRNGILLYKIYKDENRSIKHLEEIPLTVRLATLAAEDAEFYTHRGISIKGITRAVYKYFTEQEITGGSTITQQLVKNALLTPEKTLSRKLKEIILAMWVEYTYNKDTILEMYLNEVPYGGTAYGIQEASKEYFGKDVDRLSLAESALLAGLPRSPSRYSPFGPNQEEAIARQHDVLRLMRINGYITASEEESAKKEIITFVQHLVDIKAPHYVMYVRDILENQFGKEVVTTGGLEITTTLDMGIQKLAEAAVEEELEKLAKLHVTNAAVIVMQPQTGEILAMVGSQDYFDVKNGGNVNVTTSLRQPGSSIKVINYTYALSHGYTPASIILDSPITYNIQGQPPYTPKNYDGSYRGNITLRSAFAESRNIPAVKVLSSYGVKNMIEMGKAMGITTWEDTNRFGLSLTLGGGEVKLIDLARVYATIANYGNRPEINSLLSVKNYENNILYTNNCTEFRVTELDIHPSINGENCNWKEAVDERVSYIITDVLKDNSARSPAFGNVSQLVIQNHPEVAVKTGTSNNLKDNLTVGYTQKYLVAVWVGNNDGSPMSRVASGVTGASPIFNHIMSALLANQTTTEWSVPAGLEKVAICTYTGTLPCSGCPVKTEWFLNDNKPKNSCSSEYVEELKEKLNKQKAEVPQTRL